MRNAPRAIATWILAGTCAMTALASCDRPCQRLADRLCEEAGSDDAACQRWRDRIERVSAETCEVSLRALEREKVH
jgi:hypothetical protein